MKITLNIKDWQAATVLGKHGQQISVPDGSQLDVEDICDEVIFKLTKVETMQAASKSNVGGTLSFHNDG